MTVTPMIELLLTTFNETIPAPILLVIGLGSHALALWLGHLSTRDQTQTNALSEAMRRHAEIDEHQRHMMEEFKEEIRRVKDDILFEREQNIEKTREINELHETKQELLALISEKDRLIVELERERIK